MASFYRDFQDTLHRNDPTQSRAYNARISLQFQQFSGGSNMTCRDNHQKSRVFGWITHFFNYGTTPLLPPVPNLAIEVIKKALFADMKSEHLWTFTELVKTAIMKWTFSSTPLPLLSVSLWQGPFCQKIRRA